MKIYLIAALFLAALVVAHADDADTIELPEQPEQLDQPDQPEEELNDPVEDDTEDVNPPGTEGDTEESEDEEVENEEDEEEEDPEKRRRRNVLSRISCIRLKQRKYCRHAFIRRLCAATCYVPPPVCRDLLSRISCLRLRGYRKCNTFVGRTYCRRTCRRCPVIRGPCRNYAVLGQRNRRKSLPRGNVLLCDQRGFARRWYRFVGAAGSRMPTRPPPKNRCGTHAPGWMVGSYPRRRGQVVNRKVCYHWGRKTCNWSNNIKVKNCGRYYVFYLSPTPVCHLRYCGNA